MTAASECLEKLVNEFAEDHEKFESKGNHSAAVRSRKKLQEIKHACTEIKAETLAKEAAKKDA